MLKSYINLIRAYSQMTCCVIPLFFLIALRNSSYTGAKFLLLLHHVFPAHHFRIYDKWNDFLQLNLFKIIGKLLLGINFGIDSFHRLISELDIDEI